jgi:VCBS repeat-containing protein/predicted outer membrane repeat protein
MKSRTFNQGIIFRVLLTFALAAGMSSLPVGTAHAATLTVTSLADDGAGSLRQAIAGAVSGDTITFASSLSGGTIHLASTLTLSQNVTLDGSVLASQVTLSGDTDGDGTGDVRVFYVNSGVTFDLQNLTVANGYADEGGGIFNDGGTLNVTDSTFSGNHAESDGGGIFTQSTLSVTNSTFSGNSAGSNGGAILNYHVITVTNSTFSGNSAVGGGAIANFDARSTVIANSTFSGNSGTNGGGLFNKEGNVTLKNSIFANSTSGGNCFEDFDDGGGNLVWGDTTCPGDNADPKLGALGSNGGSTQTFPLLAGSAAIDAGNDATCTAAPVNNLDQRGVTRPQGTHCDIGAYEYIPPVVTLTLSAAQVNATENNYVLLDTTAVVSTTGSSWTGGVLDVQVTGNAYTGDKLRLQNQGTAAGQVGVSGTNVTYGGTTIGTLAGQDTTGLSVTFNASATTVSVRSVVRRIQFNPDDENTSSLQRTVSYSLSDGTHPGAGTGTKLVNVTPVDDPPKITGWAGDKTYIENAAPLILDTNVTINDPDVPDLASGSGALTVTITANASADDRLGIRNQGTGAGQIGLSGTDVTYGGGVIGTISPSDDGLGSHPLTVLFNTSAGNAAAQALARNLTYWNVSDDPSTLTRSVQLFATDGSAGVTSNLKNLYVVAVNDPPKITGWAGDKTYTENAAPLVLDTNVTINDPDVPDLASGSGALTVAIMANASADDRLGIRNQGTGAGQIGVSGSNVTYEGVLIGTVSPSNDGVGTHPLTVLFNTSAGNAAAQALARNLTYWNVSEDPSTLTRSVQLSATDGTAGAASNLKSLFVVAVDDPPKITGWAGDKTYTENAAPLILDTNVTINDPDVPDLASGNGALTVTITANASADDRLGIRNQGTGAGQIGVSGTDVTYGGGVIGTISPSDDGVGTHPLTVLFTTSAGNAAAQALARKLTYWNVSEDPSTLTRSVQLSATDGTAGAASILKSLFVVAVDDPPVITSDSAFNVAENHTAVTTITATDPDSSILTYSISGGADAVRFSMDGSTGVLAFVTAPDFEVPTDANADNVYEVSVQVSDGSLTDTQAIAVTVTAVNDNDPVITSNGGGGTAAVDVAENTTAVTTVTATDADLPAQTLTYSISGGADAAKFSIDGSTGALVFVTAPDFEVPTDVGTDNVYDVIVQVSDGSLTDTQAIAVTITAVNDAPVANAQSVSTAEDTAKAITLTGSDADGDPLTYSIVTGPWHGSLSGAAPNVTYTPAANYNGSDSFTFKVNDGTVDSAPATVSITVTPVNDAPVANAQSVTTAEDTAKAITLTGSDADGDPLTYSVVVGPSHGTLSGTAPNVTYTPAANYNGADSFTFKGNDGTVDSAPATVSITVTPVNDAPVANAQSVTTAEDTAKAITLTGTDADGAPLTYSVVVGPSHGTLSGTAPNVTYTPAANYNGADSFTFKVNDGIVDSVPATVSITVTPVNNAPTNIALSNNKVSENRPAGTTVGTLTTTDPDVGQTFIYSLNSAAGCSGTNNSSFQISGPSLKTKAVFNYETKKSYTLCIQTSDGHGGTFKKQFTITVTDLPETFTSTGSLDGWVLESTETSRKGRTLDATATTFNLGDDAKDRQYISILSFNTASLPDNAIISKVTLKIKRQSIVGTNPFTTHGNVLVDIRKGYFSTSAALQAGDFQASASLPSAGKITNAPLAGNWYQAVLKNTAFAYINKTSLTQFRLRFTKDDNDDLNADYLKFYSGNYSNSSYRPVLLIEYTVP